MGVKTRRLLPVDLIHKNGLVYAKRGKQNHRVCDCRVFYMNCVKCNDKYARRKSDYMSVMVKHARETSVKRAISRPGENHEFNDLRYYRLILERISSSGFLCECELCMSGVSRQKLSIRGPNKMSMDRIYDNLGYTHVDQVLRLISKNHHSSQKRDAVPVCVVRPRRWSEATISGIIKRSKKRYERTSKEVFQMERAKLDVRDMVYFLNTHVVDKQEIRRIIYHKKSNTKQCTKCNIELDYGDIDGFLLTKNNPRQASPDRINDRVGYTEENLRMVCCACQTMGEVDDVDDIFLEESEVRDLETYIQNKIGSMI